MRRETRITIPQNRFLDWMSQNTNLTEGKASSEQEESVDVPGTPETSLPASDRPLKNINDVMVAVPLRVLMQSFNHLSYALKAGAFNSCSVDELKLVVDNVLMNKKLIPPAYLKMLS